MSEQMLLHQSSAAEETGAYRPDWDAEDFGGGFVRLIFEIHQHERRVERLWEARERVLNR
jgi:hypothetical protein